MRRTDQEQTAFDRLYSAHLLLELSRDLLAQSVLCIKGRLFRSDDIPLVEEDDHRSHGKATLKQLLDAIGAPSKDGGLDLGRGGSEKIQPTFNRKRLGRRGLAGSLSSDEQQTLWNRYAVRAPLLWLSEKVADELETIHQGIIEHQVIPCRGSFDAGAAGLSCRCDGFDVLGHGRFAAICRAWTEAAR